MRLLIAFGVTFIIMGSVDLSMEAWWRFGVVAGTLNGLAHVRFKIPSFMASLSIGYVGLAATFVLTGGYRTNAQAPNFRSLLTKRLFETPYWVYFALLGLAFALFVERWTQSRPRQHAGPKGRSGDRKRGQAVALRACVQIDAAGRTSGGVRPHRGEDRLPLPLFETVLSEKGLNGSVPGMGLDMHDALTLLRHDRFALKPFLGKSYPIEDMGQAFERLADDISALKAQIVP